MELLLPSVTINKGQRSKDQILLDAKRKNCLETKQSDKNETASLVIPISEDLSESALIGTSWRKKKRKRRQLKAEKVAYDPKPVVTHFSREEEDGSSDDEIESEDEKTPISKGSKTLQLPQSAPEEGNALDEKSHGNAHQNPLSKPREVQTANFQLAGKGQLPQSDQVACEALPQTKDKESGKENMGCDN